MRSLLLVAALVLAHPALAQEKVVGNNVDVRTLLAFKASDAAVQKIRLPPDCRHGAAKISALNMFAGAGLRPPKMKK
jgi:hypothetical protein